MDLRRTSAPALVLALILPLLSACTDKNAAAVVNGEVITKQRFELARDSMLRRLSMGQEPDPSMLQDPELIRGTLDNLIGSFLLHQEAVKAGFSASPEAIDRTIAKLKDSAPSPEKFAEELTKRGITDAVFREDVARQLVLESYVEKGMGVPEPSDAEVKDFYDKSLPRMNQAERVRASHILLKLSPASTAEEKAAALAKAKELAARARKGEDFGALAKAHSADGSAQRGGDLGYFGRGQMVKPFEDAAFSLKVAQVSDPVLSEFGYHVIKVVDHKSAGLPALDEVKPRIVEYLKGMKTQETLEKKVAELRAAAKVKILVEIPSPKAPAMDAPAGTPKG